MRREHKVNPGCLPSNASGSRLQNVSFIDSSCMLQSNSSGGFKCGSSTKFKCGWSTK